MNAEIINLRRAKKNLARAESEKQAEANRVKFGRSKVEKNISSFQNSKSKSVHLGHKLPITSHPDESRDPDASVSNQVIVSEHVVLGPDFRRDD